LETTRGLIHHLKISRTLAYKRLKIGPGFLSFIRSVNSAFCFIARRRTRRPQTELKLRQTKGGHAFCKTSEFNIHLAKLLHLLTDFVPRPPILGFHLWTPLGTSIPRAPTAQSEKSLNYTPTV